MGLTIFSRFWHYFAIVTWVTWKCSQNDINSRKWVSNCFYIYFLCISVRSHISLMFDVTSAMGICHHDNPFGQRTVHGALPLTWLLLCVQIQVVGLLTSVAVLSKKFRHNIGDWAGFHAIHAIHASRCPILARGMTMCRITPSFDCPMPGNCVFMRHLMSPYEICNLGAWIRRCGWDVLVLSPLKV